MRKIIGAIILGIMMSTFVYAQESAEQETSSRTKHRQRGENRMSPEERADRMINHLTEKLDLTEAQQTQIKDFHLEQDDEGRTAMAEADTLEDRHEIRKKHRQQMDEKIKSLLSEDQLKAYETMKENRPARGPGKNHRWSRQ